MKKRCRLIIVGLVVFLLAVSVFLFRKNRSRRSFKTALVSRKNLTKIISASGEVKSEKEITLKFQTSGKLAWVGVKEGDQVKKWQAIASLDKRELEKNLKKELLDYMNERWDFQADRETYNVSTDNLDQYTLSNAARRILEKAQFDLNRDVIDVEIAHLAVELATIITPIEGIVTKIETPVAGVNITPATAEFIIADPKTVFFEINVDEIDIGQIKKGQKVIISLDAYPEEKIESEVKQISFQAETTSGGGTAFRVKTELPENKDLKFRLGMNGDAEIIIKERENVLAVPASAVMKRKNRRYVFIVKNGRAHKQEVKMGLITDTEVEIVSGLNQRDEVISEKISKVKDGQRIK